MNAETVLAKLHAELWISEDLQKRFSWIAANDPGAWFARDAGDLFLAENGRVWDEIFVRSVEEEVLTYFRQLGLEEENLPRVLRIDSRRGTWIIDAVLALAAPIGTAFAILKGVSEIPKIADGLVDLKNRVQKRLTDRVNSEFRDRLEPFLSNKTAAAPSLAAIPAKPVQVTFSIDARPLLALTPEKIETRKIQLSVGLSRSALSVENLGTTDLDNLRLGLFKPE
jgi:hypothetical protein